MTEETHKVKVHKITLLVVDHDQCGSDEITTVIENQKFPNRCISPDVMSIETREVDYNDDHPINKTDGRRVTAFKELFSGTPSEETGHKGCPFCGVSTDDDKGYISSGATSTEWEGVVTAQTSCGNCGASGPEASEYSDELFDEDEGFPSDSVDKAIELAWKAWDMRK